MPHIPAARVPDERIDKNTQIPRIEKPIFSNEVILPTGLASFYLRQKFRQFLPLCLL